MLTDKCKVRSCDKEKERRGYCFAHYMRVRQTGSPRSNEPIGFYFHRQSRENRSTYTSWALMKARCLNKNNPKYPDYGGRGIKLCRRWIDFKKFFEDMGPKPSNRYSIDRINNSKGYFPNNCRWATSKQQANNRRMPERKR